MLFTSFFFRRLVRSLIQQVQRSIVLFFFFLSRGPIKDQQEKCDRNSWRSISSLICHLQGTLKSIEGQPLDSQFVLATHSLAVSTWPGDDDNCNVQLFSHNGQYRFVVRTFLPSSSSSARLCDNIYIIGRRHAALEHLFRLQIGRQSHQLRRDVPIVGPRHLVGTRVFGADDIDRSSWQWNGQLGSPTRFEVYRYYHFKKIIIDIGARVFEKKNSAHLRNDTAGHSYRLFPARRRPSFGFQFAGRPSGYQRRSQGFSLLVSYDAVTYQ